MKAVAGYVVVAIVLVVLGGICLGASRLDGLMVNAQQTFLTSDYDSADASLRAAARHSRSASAPPGVCALFRVGARPAVGRGAACQRGSRSKSGRQLLATQVQCPGASRPD